MLKHEERMQNFVPPGLTPKPKGPRVFIFGNDTMTIVEVSVGGKK